MGIFGLLSSIRIRSVYSSSDRCVNIYDARDPEHIVNVINQKLLRTGAWEMHSSATVIGPSNLVTRGA